METVNSSLPPSPTPLRSGQKRKYQGRIDELFLPETGIKERKSRRVILDSESDSEDLGNIQLEPERVTDPSVNDTSASDADTDDVIGPRVRRRRRLPPLRLRPLAHVLHLQLPSQMRSCVKKSVTLQHLQRKPSFLNVFEMQKLATSANPNSRRIWIACVRNSKACHQNLTSKV